MNQRFSSLNWKYFEFVKILLDCVLPHFVLVYPELLYLCISPVVDCTMHPRRHKADAPVGVFFSSFTGGKASDAAEQCHA